MKRFLVVLVVASMALTTSLLGVTTIKFMNFSSADANAMYLEEMRKIFEEQNPDIKVQIETVGFGDYFTKLMTVVAGGNAPDAFELNYENFYTYAKKGVLLNLNDLVATSVSTPVSSTKRLCTPFLKAEYSMDCRSVFQTWF